MWWQLLELALAATNFGLAIYFTSRARHALRSPARSTRKAPTNVQPR